MKLVFPLFFCLIVCSSLSEARASELSPPGTRARKLERGFLNVAFAPVEISTALADQKTKDEALIPWLVGFGKGLWFASLRAFTGVYDLLTAPLPLPADYGPLVRPEFSLEHLDLLKEDAS